MFIALRILTNYINTRSKDLLQKPSVPQTNSSSFTQKEFSFSCPQNSSTWSYLALDQSNSCPSILLPYDLLNIFLPSTPESSKCTLSFKSLTKFLYAPILSPYLLHATPISLFVILVFVNYFILLLKLIFIVQHKNLPLLALIVYV